MVKVDISGSYRVVVCRSSIGLITSWPAGAAVRPGRARRWTGRRSPCESAAAACAPGWGWRRSGRPWPTAGGPGGPPPRSRTCRASAPRTASSGFRRRRRTVASCRRRTGEAPRRPGWPRPWPRRPRGSVVQFGRASFAASMWGDPTGTAVRGTDRLVGLATAPHLLAIRPQALRGHLLLIDEPAQLLLLGLELGPLGGNLGFQGLALALQLALAALDLLPAAQGLGLLARLLGQPHRPGEYPLRSDVHVLQLDAVVGQEELTDLVGMGHAARLEDEQAAVALTSQLEVAHE